MSAPNVSSRTILQTLQFRHACKVFDPKRKIPEDLFELIMEAAHLSPSSYGFEPWRFLIVQNMALREKLRTVTWGAQRSLPTASHFIIALARTSKDMRFDADYIWSMMRDVHHLPAEHLEKRKSLVKNFQESDFQLLESERALLDWASKQTYIALANMMTVAALMGIDSCPVEGFPMNKVNAILREDFEIDTEHFRVSYMVAFGYRSESQPPKSRQPRENIFQRYD